MSDTIYLDHAATTPLRPEAHRAMSPFLDDVFGNPSGIHGFSRRAKNSIEEARERAAELLGAAKPLEIVFTGGGTEADNLAVAGTVLAGDPKGGVVTSAVEHEAVLETTRFLAGLGHTTEVVGVDELGRVDPEAMAAATGEGTTVVSLMAANNETGCLQPVRKVAERVRAMNPDAAVHTDAVQAFISEPITALETGADLIALAAHKFGGPKGVGLLYVRDGIDLEPVLHGGGQELGRRSGTHNVAGIVGMVAAMEATVAGRAEFRRRVGEARDRFEAAVQSSLPGVEINAPVDQRLVQHAHLRIPGVSAETLLIRLDQDGIAAATGSACQSGAVDTSHVLTAMGMTDEEAAECARFTFGWINTPTDGEIAAERVIEVVKALR